MKDHRKSRRLQIGRLEGLEGRALLAQVAVVQPPGTPQASGWVTTPAIAPVAPMNESSFKAMTAGEFADGRLSLWVVDADGNLWGRWQNTTDPGSGWSAWMKAGPVPAPLQK